MSKSCGRIDPIAPGESQGACNAVEKFRNAKAGTVFIRLHVQ